MPTLFKLPLLGQTMQEGTILRWLKQEGDSIESWEPLVEVMTDKVNMEVEPAVSGVVRKLLVPEGATVLVGAPLAVIAAADEAIDGVLADLSGGGEAAPPPVSPAAAPVEARAEASPPSVESSSEMPPVSPRARQLAEESGIAWRSLVAPGTGFEGMVVERDVRAYLETGAAPTRLTPLAARIAAEHGVAPEQLPEGRGRIRAAEVRRAVDAPAAGPAAPVAERRLAGMRKVIAERLAASYQAAPHVPLRVEVDMAAAVDLRRQAQSEAERRGGRLTYTDVIAAALARALRDDPALNATLEGDLVRQHAPVHLGVAVALEDGLTVPVVRDAHALSLFELSDALRELAASARAGRLPPDAYAGGTFTLTNLGQYGVDSFDPILNAPQIGIMGAGRIAERLVAYQGAPAVRPTMVLTLTFDHRAVDGVPAARLLASVRELLEQPVRLLL